MTTNGMNGNGVNGHGHDDEVVCDRPSICVFTASALGNEPAVQGGIEEFAETAMDAGFGFTYGGGHAGNMGILAKVVERKQGGLVGVMPTFLEEREGRAGYGKHIVATPGMHKRKRLMFKNSVAFVAFPGGLGTLEEAAEMMTWEQLGQHKKPVVIANIKGFWDPLIQQFERMIAWGYAGYPGKEIHLRVAETVGEILPLIQGHREGRVLRMPLNGSNLTGSLSLGQLNQL
ncbi:MAG: TIGR00730 family Rossman fold protein [Candidatus Uhrbacteria bacterium]|nr:TIGR00730 family Rossman fold protein [Candidatus Uhrbacteria bacterium]